MSPGLADALDRLVEAYHRGAHLLLLFDYDGTLVSIVEHPRMARLSAAVRLQLEQLAALPAVSVGVVSGRALDDLRECVRLKDVFYVGTSGLELAFGETPTRSPDAQQAATQVIAAAQRIRGILATDEAAWVEQKPLGLTVHYRGVHADRIPSLRADVARAITSLGYPFRALDGPMAIEITPDLGWTKASALRMILAGIDRSPVLPLYVGDDTNDADALAAAAALGGVAIGVGARAPATAQYRLPDPGSVALVLDGLLDSLAGASQRS